MVKVNIRVKETVIYDQTIEVTEEQYKQLKKYDEEDVCFNNEGYHLIEGVVNKDDIFDNTGEWQEFTIEEMTE